MKPCFLCQKDTGRTYSFDERWGMYPLSRSSYPGGVVALCLECQVKVEQDRVHYEQLPDPFPIRVKSVLLTTTRWARAISWLPRCKSYGAAYRCQRLADEIGLYPIIERALMMGLSRVSEEESATVTIEEEKGRNDVFQI